MGKYFPGPTLSLTIDDETGTPVDVSRFVRSVETPEEVAQLDGTAFQAEGLERQPGFSSGQIVLGGNWESVFFRFLHGVKRTQRADSSTTFTYTLGPQGTTAGKVKYSGEAILSRFDRTTAVDALSGIAATFRIVGPNVESVFP